MIRQLDEWVLCIIYQNGRNENKQKKITEAANSSINKGERPEPAVEGCVRVDLQFENHNGVSEDDHNKNEVHISGGSNASTAEQVVQEHLSIGKANVTVDDNFLFDDYLFETFDFSSEDSLEWLQELMNS